MVDSFNITLTSYGYLINLFPIAMQLKNRSYANVIKSALLALVFVFTAYVILTSLSMNIFGEHNIQMSIFENLKTDNGLLSIGIRLLFLIIFLCNIPYLFFPGKISILNALQEYRFKCFSKVLEKNT